MKNIHNDPTFYFMTMKKGRIVMNRFHDEERIEYSFSK